VLHITPWERSALQLLATDPSTAQLANRFGLAERDIERRLAELFLKMGAATRTEAITVASRRGLLDCLPAGPTPIAPGLDA